ncbi:hypothetical protein Bca4012_042459 [Brassica carinata]
MFSRVSLSTAISGIFSYAPQIILITMRLRNFDGERLRRPCPAISPKVVPPISIEKVFLPQSLALRFCGSSCGFNSSACGSSLFFL